ncbi:superoxide dismutase family protein [Guyparkeria hydrothermalis]|uniref:superoxide dismutase [Cu-Zn] SodC n=1 Tax=Guyparkeria hydrothermalis TaxID=923 RepID=UPI0020201093|nr:superoxide dismutase [Cu-Zn] SodC [Guyparkeria hydrothermalis]MCL7745186.1 superoxide dismutase family protein [Guyparkeria hydrothermalis]
MKTTVLAATSLFTLLAAGYTTAADGGMADGKGIDVPMYAATPTGPGQQVGVIHAQKSENGVVLQAKLQGLTPGAHGFHVHENPSCEPKEKNGEIVPALAAGGHYDPQGTGKHEGPAGEGHLGDLPPLKASAKGSVDMTVTAPRLKLADIRNRSLMIHADGDNFADQPKPLGGGGARVACGVVE